MIAKRKSSPAVKKSSKKVVAPAKKSAGASKAVSGGVNKKGLASSKAKRPKPKQKSAKEKKPLATPKSSTKSAKTAKSSVKAKAPAKKAPAKKTTAAKKAPPKKTPVAKKAAAAKKASVAKKAPAATNPKAQKKAVTSAKKQKTAPKVSAKKAPTKAKPVAKAKAAAKTKPTVKAKTTAKKAPGQKPSAPKTSNRKAQAQTKKAGAAQPLGNSGSESTAAFTPYQLKRNEPYMNEPQQEHFRSILLNWRKQLMEEVDRTVSHMKDEAANYPDPSDRASQEEEFSLELRTRDRERKLIRKIEKTTDLIDQDEYGYCETCGIEIGIRRLEARPTATQCIDCKTLDELKERQLHG